MWAGMRRVMDVTSTEEAERAARVAVLPIGSFEQHGDHLPLTTDTLVACAITDRIATAYDLFALPPVTVSCSHEHEGFAGTVSISPATLGAVIHDIRDSLARSGISRLVLVNGHGGNYLLSNLVQQANVTDPTMALFPQRHDFLRARENARMETGISEDMHGGEWETSILLHVCPDVVRDSYRDSDHDASDRPHLLVTGMRHYTPSGVIGRPSIATAEKGHAVLDSLTSSFADVHALLIDAAQSGPTWRGPAGRITPGRNHG
jgi:creatinine amidohydrolase